MNLTHTNKPIRIRFYLLIVSVEPETEVLYTSKGWPAGPWTTLPAVSKIELWQVQVNRLLVNDQLSKQPEWVHTEVKATYVPLRFATKVLAEVINNHPPEAASLFWIVRFTCTVFPEMVIPLGAVVLGGVVVSSGSSELTQEVKKAVPKEPITAAKPAFSKNFLRDSERLPDFKNWFFSISSWFRETCNTQVINSFEKKRF